MKSKYEEIIYKIEDVVESAWKVPMGGKRYLVDIEELGSLVQELKESLPDELAEAKKIVDNKDKIIQYAKDNCEEIYKVAKQKVQSMVDDHEIVRLARKKESEIKENLIKQSQSLATSSRERLNKSLDELELSLSSISKQINEAKKSFRNIR